MGYKNMLRNARASGATKTLSPIFKEFKNAGDVIVGKFLEIGKVKSSMSEGDYNHYIFDTDEGLVKFALGAATDKEAGVLMQTGHVYAITYKGKEEISGGRRVNKFNLEELLELDDTPPIVTEEPQGKTKKS